MKTAASARQINRGQRWHEEILASPPRAQAQTQLTCKPAMFKARSDARWRLAWQWSPSPDCKPSALAVSLISPASFVDCTMTCARPLNRLRDHGDAVAWPTISTFTSGFKPPSPVVILHAHGDDVVAGVQRLLDVEQRLRLPSRAIRRRAGCSRTTQP